MCLLPHYLSVSATESLSSTSLDQSLGKHSFCNLDKARNVSSGNVVARHSVLCSSVGTVLVNRSHDCVELGVNFLSGPVVPGAVLCHLQSRNSDTTGIRSLARAIKDSLLNELFYPLWCSRHVGSLTNRIHASGQKVVCIFPVDLVLSSARKRDICLDRPQRVVVQSLVNRIVRGAWEFGCVLAYSSSLHVLKFQNVRELFGGDSFRVVDPAPRIRACNNLGPELDALLDGVLRDVARSGHQDSLAL
mmetsp:Transcript_24118/g.34737  ORF Transcript_24118/g.34737 Transcript_24118/m.34737 type:complete len:247 (-) Transcript_24118:861-1601(-)